MSGQSEIPGPIEVIVGIESGLYPHLMELPDGSDGDAVRNAWARSQVIFEQFFIDPLE
jgi:hypothetical protein